MEHFFCSTCDNPLKIKEGDYLFTYNIECSNNHISKNVDLEDILSTKKEKSYICESHKKSKIIHCINCNEDICFLCYKESHHLHKMEYLKSLNFDEIHKNIFDNELDDDKMYIKDFIDELMHFKNELNLYIEILKSDLQKYYRFKCDLLNNISPKITSYINIENFKNVFVNKNLEIKKIIKSFLSCDSFIQRFDNLKNIFELMFKKGKYIENEYIKDIYKEKIIPIDEKYFMKIDQGKLIILEKTLELNLRKYKFKNIFEKLINFRFSCIKLKENNNIRNKLSLYALSYLRDRNNNVVKTLLYEITIENLCDYSYKKIATYDKFIYLIVLSEDKIIIGDKNEISLYDESFKSPKLVSNEVFDINICLKIDENTFVYSMFLSDYIFLAEIIDNKIYKTEIKHCGNKLIYLSKKKKLIFTHDGKYIYLINFNSTPPEVIQKVEIRFPYKDKNLPFHNVRDAKIIRYLTSFNDDSIYFECDQFLVQYKIIEGELIEISRINYI